jgi:UDP-N-acetylmuramate--alanine ligase
MGVFCDIRPKNIELLSFSSEFNCLYKDKDLGRINLALPGIHNIINSLSVIGLALELGIDFKDIKESLESYVGVERRFQLKFNSKDLILIDDYGHHPTEIRATLEAIKFIRHKRFICIFQPHRYTRTKLLLDDFSKAFDSVDLLILTDIYPANEPPIEGVSSKAILERIKEFRENNVLFLPKEEITDYILNIIEPGDLILTIGAGDIGKVSDELAERIKEKVTSKF